MSDDEKSTGQVRLRADARRNEVRVLEGARDAFARHGFDASYHQIARAAGVGVGTVYRRYPNRDALVEAVLLDILSGLTDEAVSAAASADAWAAFEHFFRSLAERMKRHAGLSSQVGMRSSASVNLARAELWGALEQLCQRAAPYLRAGIGWEDVAFFAQLTTVTDCGLGVEITEERRQLAIATILHGVHRNASE